ncbi:hypothetical protein ZWY2020_034639 [Hordeum vulgare]|nr:hypothetical protein ZWY2020_034639 [Hordeum vulgare]
MAGGLSAATAARAAARAGNGTGRVRSVEPRQWAGWRRALEDGPWWFDKALLVLEEYDPMKIVDEYAFKIIPIWIRVYGLPLGYMHRYSSWDIIAKNFQELVEVDVGPDGAVVGKFLWVKVKLDISVPLMRGFLLDREKDSKDNSMNVEKEKEKQGKKVLWCGFEYEYLPDFCYTCGIIGHGEKECVSRPKAGEAPQFGPWMRAADDGRKGTEGGRIRRSGNWGGGRGPASGGESRGSEWNAPMYEHGRIQGQAQTQSWVVLGHPGEKLSP